MLVECAPRIKEQAFDLFQSISCDKGRMERHFIDPRIREELEVLQQSLLELIRALRNILGMARVESQSKEFEHLDSALADLYYRWVKLDNGVPGRKKRKRSLFGTIETVFDWDQKCQS